MSGVAADTINQIELGHRKPRPSTLRKLARALEVDVEEFYREPALPLAEAPDTGHLSIIDVAWDAARRQVALEKQTMFSGHEGSGIDQSHANEAMRRLREEHGLDGNDAEALINFALERVREKEETTQIREENAVLRDRLQEHEQAHS